MLSVLQTAMFDPALSCGSHIAECPGGFDKKAPWTLGPEIASPNFAEIQPPVSALATFRPQTPHFVWWIKSYRWCFRNQASTSWGIGRLSHIYRVSKTSKRWWFVESKENLPTLDLSCFNHRTKPTAQLDDWKKGASKKPPSKRTKQVLLSWSRPCKKQRFHQSTQVKSHHPTIWSLCDSYEEYTMLWLSTRLRLHRRKYLNRGYDSPPGGVRNPPHNLRLEVGKFSEKM